MEMTTACPEWHQKMLKWVTDARRDPRSLTYRLTADAVNDSVCRCLQYKLTSDCYKGCRILQIGDGDESNSIDTRLPGSYDEPISLDCEFRRITFTSKGLQALHKLREWGKRVPSG